MFRNTPTCSSKLSAFYALVCPSVSICRISRFNRKVMLTKTAAFATVKIKRNGFTIYYWARYCNWLYATVRHKTRFRLITTTACCVGVKVVLPVVTTVMNNTWGELGKSHAWVDSIGRQVFIQSYCNFTTGFIHLNADNF